MRRFLLALGIVAACGLGRTAEPGREPFPSLQSTNMEVFAEDGLEYDHLRDVLVFRGNVRVTNGPTTLRCETLTVAFQTNQPSGPAASSRSNRSAAVPAAFGTNQMAATKVDRIVAETGVVIAQGGSRATADRVTYTSTNETVELTGRLVVMETQEGRLECTRVILDRTKGTMKALNAPGLVHMQLRSDAFGQPGIGLLATNALRLPGLKTRATNAPSRK
jgi:lipopolysaccharide export system protein LptA